MTKAPNSTSDLNSKASKNDGGQSHTTMDDNNVASGSSQADATTGGAGAKCPRCFNSVTPMVDTYPTTKTHVLAAILFLLGLPFCVCLPYIFDIFGTKVNRCPKCGCVINSHS